MQLQIAFSTGIWESVAELGKSQSPCFFDKAKGYQLLQPPSNDICYGGHEVEFPDITEDGSQTSKNKTQNCSREGSRFKDPLPLLLSLSLASRESWHWKESLIPLAKHHLLLPWGDRVFPWWDELTRRTAPLQPETLRKSF